MPLEPVNIHDQPVSASATFEDPAGEHDTPYTCTVDYGDGSGGPRAVTEAASITYAYDGAGQMTMRGGQTFAWDHLGQLVGIVYGKDSTPWAETFPTLPVQRNG